MSDKEVMKLPVGKFREIPTRGVIYIRGASLVVAVRTFDIAAFPSESTVEYTTW